MMNIPPSEAKTLTLCEYQSLLFNWEKAHSSDEDTLEPPDPAFAEARRRKLEQSGVKVLY